MKLDQLIMCLAERGCGPLPRPISFLSLRRIYPGVRLGWPALESVIITLIDLSAGLIIKDKARRFLLGVEA
jgi:hypothetical protein